jgi:hypothetical protein
MAHRLHRELDAAVGEHDVRGGQKPSDPLLRKTHKGCIDFATVAGADDLNLSAQCRGRCLRVFDPGLRNHGIARIDKHRKSCGSRQQFMQQPQPFARKLGAYRGKTGDISARSLYKSKTLRTRLAKRARHGAAHLPLDLCDGGADRWGMKSRP